MTKQFDSDATWKLLPIPVIGPPWGLSLIHIWAERDFTTRVGRNRHEALVSIAVGHAFADDRIPEQHARLGRLPGIVDDLVPELPGVDG